MEQNISSGIYQNYLQLKKALNILVELLGLIHGNLIGFQKKILKILLNLTAISQQLFLIIIYYQT